MVDRVGVSVRTLVREMLMADLNLSFTKADAFGVDVDRRIAEVDWVECANGTIMFEKTWTLDEARQK